MWSTGVVRGVCTTQILGEYDDVVMDQVEVEVEVEVEVQVEA